MSVRLWAASAIPTLGRADRRVLNTCLYLGFRADLADREEAEIR
jgi:hypothetical protein